MKQTSSQFVLIDICVAGNARYRGFACEGIVSAKSVEGNFEYELNTKFHIPHIPTVAQVLIPAVKSVNASTNQIGRYSMKALTHCTDLQDNSDVIVQYTATPYHDIETLTSIPMIGVRIDGYKKINKLAKDTSMIGTELTLFVKTLWILQLIVVLRLLYKKIT